MQMRTSICYLYSFWSLAELQGGDGCLYPREDFRGEKDNQEQEVRTYKINSFKLLRFDVYR